MNSEQQRLRDWLKAQGFSSFELTAIPGDASFRRYYRVHQGAETYMLMDAHSEKASCVPFVAIADALRQKNLHTPEILAKELHQGWLLLSDFGSQHYREALNDETADRLYGRALDALAILQTCNEVPGYTVPRFTDAFMRQELDLFKEWFLLNHLGLAIESAIEKKLNACFDFLATEAFQQPAVFMHRDYHSMNLMVLKETVGLLDFQDAFMGPITYDLVSLLRDCYIAWPEARVTQWIASFFDRLSLSMSRDAFIRQADFMGLQRHMKALLTFSRKFRRDHNANYLEHIPRTLKYILNVSERYPECQFLHAFLKQVTQEKSLCVE